jgi:hypothetical protein
MANNPILNLENNPFWNQTYTNNPLSVEKPNIEYRLRENIPLETIDKKPNQEIVSNDKYDAQYAGSTPLLSMDKVPYATDKYSANNYQTNTNKNQLFINPYTSTGGIGVDEAAYLSGMGFSAAANSDNKQTKQAGIATGILSSLATGMGVAKNVLAGIGTQKVTSYQNQRAQERMREALLNGEEGQEALFNQGYLQDSGVAFAQDGGNFQENPLKRKFDNTMPKKQEVLSVLSGRTTPQVSGGNTEVERGENINQNGDITKADGEKHSDGGTSVELQNGDRVLTDDIRIPSDLRVKIAKELGVEVTHKNTFSEVLEKYKTKIGIRKLQKEQEDVFEDLKKYNEKEYKSLRQTDTTKKINEQLISEKITEIQKQIDELQPQVAEAFDKIYDAQEYAKNEMRGNLRRKDGAKMEEEFEEGQEYEYKNGGSQIKMIYRDGGFHTSNINDTTTLINILKENKVSSDKDITKFFAKCGGIKKYREGGTQQSGGQQELMQMIAQALQQGTDPQELVSMLVEQGMPQEQAVQAIQSVTQQMQGQPQQSQPQEEMMQDGGEQGVESMIQSIVEALLQGTQPQEIFQQLVQRGLNEDVATKLLQQASTMAKQSYEQQKTEQAPQGNNQQEELLTLQDGGKVKFQDAGEFKFAREYGEMNAGDTAKLLKSIKENALLEDGNNTPPYQYKSNLEAAKNRLIQAHKSWGVPTEEVEKAKSFEDLDIAAGKYQQTLLKSNPELIQEYSREALATKQGLQSLISNGVFKNNPELYNELKASGLIDNKGNATRGISDKDNVYSSLSTALKNLNGEQLEAYANSNFTDNLWNYRTPVKQEHFFPTKEELLSFVNNPPEGIEILKKDGQTYAKQKGTNVFTNLGYYQTKDLESEEEYKNLKLNDLDDSGYEIGKDSDFGVRTAYRYKGQPIKEQPVKEDVALQEFTPLKAQPDRLHLVSPQYTLPPDALQTPAFAIQNFEKITPIKVTPEEAFKEVGKQNVSTENLITQNVGSQQGANAVASQVAYSEALNKAVSDTNRQNAQYAQQANQLNLQQDNNQENANVQGLLSYDQKQAIALANQNQSIRNYFDAIHERRVGANLETRELNTIDGLSPNYTFDEFGRVIYDNNSKSGINTSNTNNIGANIANNINYGAKK